MLHRKPANANTPYTFLTKCTGYNSTYQRKGWIFTFAVFRWTGRMEERTPVAWERVHRFGGKTRKAPTVIFCQLLSNHVLCQQTMRALSTICTVSLNGAGDFWLIISKLFSVPSLLSSRSLVHRLENIGTTQIQQALFKGFLGLTMVQSVQSHSLYYCGWIRMAHWRHIWLIVTGILSSPCVHCIDRRRENENAGRAD